MANEIEQESQEKSSQIEKVAFAIKKLLKIVGKTLWSVFKAVGSFLLANLWIVLLVLVVVVIIIAVVAIISYFFSGGYDSTTQTINSYGGVRGDSFYGTRYLYYDEEYINADLKDKYLEFTYNIIADVNDTNTINIDYTKSYNQSSQISSFCLTFASALNADLTNPTLDECIANIDHYGFTEEESNAGLGALAEVLKLYANNQESMLANLKDSYDKQEFSYMKNVCAKILIKDYIVTETEEAKNIPRKNYFGFVYMPKNNVIIEDASYIYVLDQNKTCNISIKHKTTNSVAELKTETADSSWFVDEFAEKKLTCEYSDFILPTFTAIDTGNINYLSEQKTLFDIFREGKFETFFKSEADATSASSLLENFNCESYVYLQMTADSAYNMCESDTTYKK